MQIGIFCGSFNPSYNMHREIAEELINKHYVDEIFCYNWGKYKSNLIPIIIDIK